MSPPCWTQIVLCYLATYLWPRAGDPSCFQPSIILAPTRTIPIQGYTCTSVFGCVSLSDCSIFWLFIACSLVVYRHRLFIAFRLFIAIGLLVGS